MPPEVTHGFSTSAAAADRVPLGQDGSPKRLDPAAATVRQTTSGMAVFTLSLPPCRGKMSCGVRRHASTPITKNEKLGSIESVNPTEVFKRLDRGCTDVIMVDCRSFAAYNERHINGAVNVNCTNCFTRRRLQQGKLTLSDLATSDEGREILNSRTDKDVIVYDEESQAMEDLPTGNPTLLVLNSLRNEGMRASFLKGGFKEFQNQFPRLCKTADQENANVQPSESTICRPTAAAGHAEPTDHAPNKQKDIDIPATQLLTFLYVGNEKDAADLEFLQAEGIGSVLNITQTVPCFHQDTNINYKRISVRDNSLANLKRHFDEAFVFIEAARRRHEKVLIHCSAGISRSSTVAIAYIMRYRGMSMSKAYNLVKSRRTIISPNLNFVGQLAAYEKMISQTISAQCARQAKRRTASPHPAVQTLEAAL